MCGIGYLEHQPVVKYHHAPTVRRFDMESAYWPDGKVAMRRKTNFRDVPVNPYWEVSATFWWGNCGLDSEYQHCATKEEADAVVEDWMNRRNTSDDLPTYEEYYADL